MSHPKQRMFLKRSFRGLDWIQFTFFSSTIQWEPGVGLERKIISVIEKNEAAVSRHISIECEYIGDSSSDATKIGPKDF